MNFLSLRRILTYVISFVWLINGLFCKILNFTPRHQEIVSAILGQTFAKELTILIGVSEVLMTIWILSGIKSKWCALFQIFIVILMNILEFVLVPELLLWGSFNLIFASLFCILIYYNEFVLKKTSGL